MQAQAKKKLEEEQEKRALLLQLKGKENVTKSGKKLHIYANIGSVGDVGYVLENDAGGIKLFRSEFLYIRNELPTGRSSSRLISRRFRIWQEKR